MARRYFLAIVLTILVIVVTPMLFPTAPKGVTTTTTDSTAVMPATGAPAAGTPAVGAPPAVAAPGTPLAGPGTPVVAGTDSLIAPVAATTVDTTVVQTPVATYRFSDLGASLVSAEMTGYRAMNRPGNVELAPAGAPLLRYRLVVPGDTIALSQTVFSATRSAGAGGRETLQYQATLRGRTVPAIPVAITYTFVPDSFVTRVSGTVAGVTGPAFLLVDLPSRLQSSEADSLEDQTHLAYAFKPAQGGAEGVPFSKLDPGEQRLEPGPITWAAAKSKYFLVGVLTPEGGTPFSEITITGGARTAKMANTAHATLVRRVDGGTFGFEVYAGPQEWERLVAMGREFENANPYGGWFQGVVQPFSTIVMRTLLWMHRTLDLSYGWVLVIFGVAVRVVLWPLNQNAMRSQMRTQRIQPEIQAVQQRYKNDPQRAQAEIMKVYKEHGMSPFSPIAGCLPMLIPMPVFFALFFVFQNTIEFRGVPFLWLTDISLKDPFYILPVVVAITAFLLSWIGMRGMPPNPQTKIISYAIPAMMLFFFINVASGLNLYYGVQNLASLPQQWLIARERVKKTT
jgi:YidC/Oxa1 family membrane protein insertase